MPDKNEVKCIIIHKNERYEWYLETNNGKIEDNEVAFQDFCEFLEDTIDSISMIDIDEVCETVEIFRIESETDTANCSESIDVADDFGDVFEEFSPSSGDDANIFYFMIKVTFFLCLCFFFWLFCVFDLLL